MTAGFTLSEAIIAIFIVSILFILVFRSYSTSASISMRVQNQQTVMEELLYVQQYIDTLREEYYIDMQSYMQSGNIDSQGFTNHLFLINETKQKIHISSTGDCQGTRESTCALQVRKENDGYTLLSDPRHVYMDNITFGMKPVRPYSGNIYTQLPVQDIQSQGIRIYGTIRSMPYRTGSFEHGVNVPFQTFFSLTTP